MKKFIQKTVAGVSALAMTAALSATAVPAFADEYEAVQAQNFVDSFVDENENAIAQYCVENCESLDEAAELMELYEEGCALRVAEQTNDAISTASSNDHHINGAYYSGTNVASTPHRVVLFEMNAKAAMKGNILITWNHGLVSYDSTKNKFISEGDHNLKASVDTDVDTGEEYININGRVKTTTGTVSRICRFEIGTLPKATSEAAILSAFVLDARGIYSTNGEDSNFELHTYALGDFDHNGVVDAADASYMLELITYHKISFSYDSYNASISSSVCVLAADANEDGIVDLGDVQYVNNHKAS